MLIAQQLKEENIAEYLLYMWQVEDLIRANGLDIDKINVQIVSKFDQSDFVKQEIKEWYENLIDMMRREEVVDSGHLIINKNIIISLTELHIRLLNDVSEVDYVDLYYKTLPFIVELRSRSKNKEIPELETCFLALYGFLLMRLQDKEISGETQAAISQIGSLLRMLSLKYKEEKSGPLES